MSWAADRWGAVMFHREVTRFCVWLERCRGAVVAPNPQHAIVKLWHGKAAYSLPEEFVWTLLLLCIDRARCFDRDDHRPSLHKTVL